MKTLIKYSIIALAILALVAGYLLYRFQTRTMVPEDLKDTIIYIPTNASFEQVLDTLTRKGIVRDELAFTQLAEYMNYRRNPMRPGRYEVQPGWNIIQLIRHLRGGGQAPVDVVLTNERLPENVAAKAALFLEQDSSDFMAVFQNQEFLRELGYTQQTLISIFIPNTYEMYWDSTPRSFLKRMKREHDAFWDRDNRREKARQLGLSPAEVYTLASIVEKETLRDAEKTRMAGVYLNRLQRGMLLQADPTSVFATRDFDTPRVTDYHTKFDSPYNTYLYTGLPPGPIAMSSISSIDGVLNAENHDYLYFCAVGDGSGRHAFAETLAGHNQNARRYRENLRRRGLR